MAKREFGGSEQVKESCRDERRWAWLSGIRQDVGFAFRQMRRSPGFAVTAVVTLALGIGANVIVFGVLESLVLRPIDVPHADRVMTLAHKDRTPFLVSGGARRPRCELGVFRRCRYCS